MFIETFMIERHFQTCCYFICANVLFSQKYSKITKLKTLIKFILTAKEWLSALLLYKLKF